ncbi:MAG: prepilin-type N-terminal cleavage/methylation domain-containing protein [Lachnospirales bacterium]
MKRIKKTKKRSNKGFTLVEMIVVIAILIILGAVAVPRVTKYVEDAKSTKRETEFAMAYTWAKNGLNDYRVETGYQYAGLAVFGISDPENSIWDINGNPLTITDPSLIITKAIREKVNFYVPDGYVLGKAGTRTKPNDNYQITITNNKGEYSIKVQKDGFQSVDNGEITAY